MATARLEDTATAELLTFLHPDETAASFLERTYIEPLHTGVVLIDQVRSSAGLAAAESCGPATTGGRVLAWK